MHLVYDVSHNMAKVEEHVSFMSHSHLGLTVPYCKRRKEVVTGTQERLHSSIPAKSSNGTKGISEDWTTCAYWRNHEASIFWVKVHENSTYSYVLVGTEKGMQE